MVLAQHPWVFVFGLVGNVISFLVYIAPMPTFWRIYKKKTTEEFKSLPYVCAVFSSMLWIYYAFLKSNSVPLITINSLGCVIETLYIAIFLVYAPKQAKMATFKLLVLLNMLGFSSILIVCTYIARPAIKLKFLGWICVAFAVIVFAAPLSIIRRVIKTKSVEFLPFPLSVALTISAVLWFFYGFLQKDLYVMLPNVIGFVFGVAQMVVHGIYRNQSKVEPSIDLEMELPEKMTCTNNAGQECSSTAVEAVTVVVTEARENGDDEDIEGHCPRVMHATPPSSCGANEIMNVGPAPAGAGGGALPLVDCIV